jgi:hypothetical protein
VQVGRLAAGTRRQRDLFDCVAAAALDAALAADQQRAAVARRDDDDGRPLLALRRAVGIQAPQAAVGLVGSPHASGAVGGQAVAAARAGQAAGGEGLASKAVEPAFGRDPGAPFAVEQDRAAFAAGQRGRRGRARRGFAPGRVARIGTRAGAGQQAEGSRAAQHPQRAVRVELGREARLGVGTPGRARGGGRAQLLQRAGTVGQPYPAVGRLQQVAAALPHAHQPVRAAVQAPRGVIVDCPQLAAAVERQVAPRRAGPFRAGVDDLPASVPVAQHGTAHRPQRPVGVDRHRTDRVDRFRLRRELLEAAVRMQHRQALGVIADIQIAVGGGMQFLDACAAQSGSRRQRVALEAQPVETEQAVAGADPQPAVARLRQAADLRRSTVVGGPARMHIVRQTVILGPPRAGREDQQGGPEAPACAPAS